MESWETVFKVQQVWFRASLCRIIRRQSMQHVGHTDQEYDEYLQKRCKANCHYPPKRQERPCLDCGAVSIGDCICGRPATDQELVDMLRRLAGIWPAKNHARYNEWSGWDDGPPGFQGCGPSSWDNSIRALEEDQ